MTAVLRMLVLISLAAAVLLTVSSANAGAGDARRVHTRAGMARASAALLGSPDLGPGWLAKPSPNPGHITSTCVGRLQPSESDLVEVGGASAYFAKGVDVVMQTVSVFGTSAQAGVAWSRTIAASPAECMRVSLAHVQVQAGRARKLQLPRDASAAVGYRVVGHYRSPATGQTVVMVFDQLLLRRNATMTRVFLTSFTHPFGERFENAIVHSIAERLSRGVRESLAPA